MTGIQMGFGGDFPGEGPQETHGGSGSSMKLSTQKLFFGKDQHQFVYSILKCFMIFMSPCAVMYVLLFDGHRRLYYCILS